MAFVLVEGAVVQCSHMGQVKLSQGNSKLIVSGAAVIISGMEAGLSFALGAPNVLAPCQELAKAGTPPPPSYCTATLAADPSGVATKLTVDGMGALLDNASGQAVNANDPLAKWSVLSAGQSLLAVS